MAFLNFLVSMSIIHTMRQRRVCVIQKDREIESKNDVQIKMHGHELKNEYLKLNLCISMFFKYSYYR